MTRFARLRAATMAARFTGALAAPAYAPGGGCERHSALRTFGLGGCKAEGTKFNDLDSDGKRDAGEPYRYEREVEEFLRYSPSVRESSDAPAKLQG